MVKRTLDILCSLVCLCIVAVPCLIVAVVLRFTGEGKVFYLQERIGLGGRPFRIVKFVTMLEKSPEMGTRFVTVRNDPRVLPVGRFLRKTKFNELPQFVNVLIGQMSFVGWRPLLPEGFASYSEEVREKLAHLRPGLTGIGSLAFRDEEAVITRAVSEGRSAMDCYEQNIGPFKGALEVWYFDNRSPAVDLQIMLATAWCIARPSSRCYVRWFPGLPRPESAWLADALAWGSQPS